MFVGIRQPFVLTEEKSQVDAQRSAKHLAFEGHRFKESEPGGAFSQAWRWIVDSCRGKQGEESWAIITRAQIVARSGGLRTCARCQQPSKMRLLGGNGFIASRWELRARQNRIQNRILASEPSSNPLPAFLVEQLLTKMI